MATRTEAEQAAANVRRANIEADAFEAETGAARERASSAVEIAKHSQADFERQLHRREDEAASEIKAFSDRLARVIAAKPSLVRPVPESRGLARKFLHQGVEYVEVERLAGYDSRFAELFGILTDAQNMSGRMFGADIRNDAIFGGIDALECHAWRAVVERARQLAGEVE